LADAVVDDTLADDTGAAAEEASADIVEETVALAPSLAACNFLKTLMQL
jgi:hypothetical protein